MNEKVSAALAIDGGAAGGEGNSELATQLEKEKHTSSVWAGRAKSLSDENARLKEKIRQLEAGKTVDATLANIPAEVKGDTPDEITRPALEGARRMVEDATAELDKKIEQMKAAGQQQAHQSFLQQIGIRHGRFFDSVGAGGDKEKMWTQFKNANRETYEAVIASNDASRFDMLVNQFYSYIGAPNPSGGTGGSAAPDPSTSAGGPQNTATIDPDGQKQYTSQEYLQLLEKAEDYRNAGDMKTYREMTAKLSKALNEGRVK